MFISVGSILLELKISKCSGSPGCYGVTKYDPYYFFLIIIIWWYNFAKGTIQLSMVPGFSQLIIEGGLIRSIRPERVKGFQMHFRGNNRRFLGLFKVSRAFHGDKKGL